MYSLYNQYRNFSNLSFRNQLDQSSNNIVAIFCNFISYFVLRQRNDYVYICRKKGDGAEEVGNKGISQAPKRLDEENIELIVDRHIRKTAQVGDSYY